MPVLGRLVQDMNVVIRITGYDRQLSAISLIKLIREATGDDLAVTKGRVDHLLETGEAFEIVLPNNGDATAFASKATSLGAVVDLESCGRSV